MMRDSKSKRKKSIQEVPAPRTRKPKLEHIGHNVTEYKEAQEKVISAEEVFEKTFLSLDSAAFILDAKMPPKIIDCNPAATEIFGYDREEFLSKTTKFLHVNKKTLNEFQSVLYPSIENQGFLSFFEFRMKRKSGEVFPTEHSVLPLKNEKAHIIGWISLVRDITRRKRAEEVLRSERNKLVSVFEAMADGVYIVNQEYDIEYVNPVLEKDFGSWEGRKCYEYFHDRKESCSWCKNKDVFAGKTIHWEWYSFKNQRTYDLVDTPLKNTDGSISKLEIFRDITEHKKAEEELKQSKEFLANTINALDDPFFVKDEEHRWAALNNAACEAMGRTREELIGKTDYDFFPKEQADVFWEEDKLVLETGETSVNEEEVTWHGKLHTISIKRSLFKDFLTGKKFIVGIIRDITERKKAEEALSSAIAWQEAVFEGARDAVFVSDADSRFVMVNSAACELTGFSKNELLGMRIPDLHEEEDLVAYNMYHDRIMSGEEIISEAKILRKDGAKVDTEFSNRCIEISGTAYMHTVARDFTERKKAEERLLEYQGQLKSLASELTLAEERERRRIATELHDEISQSLFISKMKLEGLQKSASDKKYDDTLDEINNSLGQIIAAMRSLIFDLSSPILYEFGFEEAVAEWLNERVEKKHGIETELEVDGSLKQLDDDIRVLLFRDVRELLTNVVKHARAKKIKVSIRKVNSLIYVSVQDDGVGFDYNKAALMVTNKEAFGLFSIRERLEYLGGDLKIDSAPGCGCRVTITSPLKREDINKDKQK